MRLILAMRVFFAVLFSGAAADRVRAALEAAKIPGAVEKGEPSKPIAPPTSKKSVRNEAITLLATLQREARFVDLAQESLEDYNDQQVGAAARDVLRDCRAVLNRLFELKPVHDQQEGADVDVPAGFDTGRYRLSGNVTGEPPFCGKLAHHGWEAAKCEVPEWSGSDQASRVVAPAEVELP